MIAGWAGEAEICSDNKDKILIDVALRRQKAEHKARVYMYLPTGFVKKVTGTFAK
jgi:hypothetical protein